MSSALDKVPVTLPLDILELIVDNVFWCFQDVPTLCALLTTSKAIFHLAAKRLYENPRETVCFTHIAKKMILRFYAFVLSLAPSTDKEAAKYLQTLHRAYPNTVQCSSGSLSGTDYLSFIRTDISTFDFFPILSAQVLKTLRDAFAHVEDDSVNPGLTDFSPSVLLRIECAVYKMIINGGSSVTLNSRIGELKHLVVPVWEQDRFQGWIANMRHLKSAAFFHPNQTPQTLAFETSETWLVEAAHDTLMASITFVRQFNNTHGSGRLRNVSIETPGGWEYGPPEEVDRLLILFRELYSLLPPMEPPKSLVYSSWIPYCLSPERDRIPLNHLTCIGYPPVLDGLNIWAIPQDKFLQQCPALQELHLDCLDSHVFRWAAEAKKQYLVTQEQQSKQGKDGNNDKLALQASPLSRGGGGGRRGAPLANLDKLRLTCPGDYAQQVLNDAVYAFGQTLCKLDVLIEDTGVPVILRLGMGNTGEHEGEAGTHEGSRWELPRLHSLNLLARNADVRLAPDALAQCPNLLEVTMDEEIPGEIFPTHLRGYQLWQQWDSPKLKKIHLLKSFALCFNPESLLEMKELEFLSLEGPYMFGQESYLVRTTFGTRYTVEETRANANSSSSTPLPLPDASQWSSWFWNLFDLEELALFGEPAFRFELSMLRHCEYLRQIHLRLGLHGRKLEFDAEQANFWDNLSNPAVESSLERLLLEGFWMMSAETLRLLMTKALRSGLKYWFFETTAMYTQGCTIGQWLEYTLQHPDLVEMIFLMEDIDPARLEEELAPSKIDRLGLEKIEAVTAGYGLRAGLDHRKLLSDRWANPNMENRLWLINGRAYTLKGSLTGAA